MAEMTIKRFGVIVTKYPRLGASLCSPISTTSVGGVAQSCRR